MGVSGHFGVELLKTNIHTDIVSIQCRGSLQSD